MRTLVVSASFALLAWQPAALAGSAADAIAEKFAHASEPARTAPNPSDAPSTVADTAERARLEAEREAETLHLAERLKAARKAKAEALEREERAAAAAPAPTPSPPPATSAAACPPADEGKAAAAAAPVTLAATASLAGTPSATILLTLDPGSYGIRRFNPSSADPVLCIGETCYVSQGPSAPAKAMPRMSALGPGNTLGARAGACKQKLSCIFRDVPLAAAKTELQPVDLHILRHDRRETTEVAADASCKVLAGRLTCGTLVRSATYRALVVPEPVAKIAGAAALEAALPALNGAKTAAAR